MSRSRPSIMNNLEEMHREAFDRAKASGEEAQLPSLDVAYRRARRNLGAPFCPLSSV